MWKLLYSKSAKENSAWKGLKLLNGDVIQYKAFVCYLNVYVYKTYVQCVNKSSS
jgi:hypothetical protein